VIGASTDSQNQNPESDLAWSAPFGPVRSIKNDSGPDFVADLLEYLEYLPPEDFQIDKVLARIDRVLWKQADLPRAGRAFYESARLLKLKWQFLESPPSSVADIFAIFRDLAPRPKKSPREMKPKNCPKGTKPIDKMPELSKEDVHLVKDGVLAGPKDYVGIAKDGTVITTDNDGKAIFDNGTYQQYLPKGKGEGR
jgi:hypothetical protein